MVVIQAKIPKELITPLIKGSKASASIMAQAYDDKFEQGIPWYRQEKEWERLGFPISRRTMTNWFLWIDKDYFQPVVSYLLKTAKKESCVLFTVWKFRSTGTRIPKLAVHPFRSDRFAYSGENGTASLGWIS